VDGLKLGDAVNLYPNPAQGQFALQGDALQGATVTVMDVLGKVIESRGAVQGDRLDFTTRDWAKGVYTVVITQGDARVAKRVMVY
jgi:hypothetical protein